MTIVYMDTIPVSSAMCIVNGFLFVAAEFGDNYMYDVTQFGDLQKMMQSDIRDCFLYNTTTLENLGLFGCQRSLSPLLQSHVFDFAHNNLKQFVFACGNGPSSSLRFQRYGVKALYKATLYKATLDKTESCLLPNSMWTVRGIIDNKHITFIVFSHPRGTIVLALEDAYTVIDCDVAFNYKLATLNCVQCTETSFIQVYHTGFRYIVNELHIEFKIRGATILQCAVYYHQIAVALVNKKGMYFEVTGVDGNASFRQMPSKVKFKSTVMCMQFVPKGFQANQLVVCFGDCLKIYHVDITRMECLSTFDFKHSPASMTIVSSEENVRDYSAIINIGFQNGILQRITLHKARIISEYSLKLGTKPVKLRQGVFGSKVVIFVLTNRPWISFYAKGRMLTLSPLDFKDEIYDVAFLSDEPSPSPNIVALSNNKDLYILSVSHYESLIDDDIVQLNYTPNLMIAHPEAKFLVISGADKVPPFYKEEEIMPQDNLDLILYSSMPKRKYDETCAIVWDSILHFFDPIEKKTIFKVHLPVNEVSTSMCLVQFKKEKTEYILIGVKQSILLEDGITTESFIYMYEVSEDGFVFLNKTIVKDVPYAICQIKDYILIGIGKMLCLYSFNHSQKILTRCASVLLKDNILSIWSRRKLFIVKTSMEHLAYGYIKVVPKPEMFMLHEDRYMHGVSCLCFWDDDVIFVGNKRRISAVILPYYEGCEKSIDPEVKRLIEKMEAANLNPSTFAEPTCVEQVGSTDKEAPHSRGRASTSRKAASPSKEKTSTSKKRSSQSKETSRKKTCRSKDTTSTVSKPSHSRDTVSKASSQRTSTFRKKTSHRSRKAYHPDKMPFKLKDPAWKAQLLYDETSNNATDLPHASPWGSKQNEIDSCYPYARFTKYSHVLVTYDVKEIVQTVQKAKLIEGGRDLIIYTTVCGAVGVLVPFLNETVSKVLQPLQFIINHHNPLFNTDWLVQVKHRESSFSAACDDDQIVIDGNLLSLYRDFGRDDQIRIANYLQRSPFHLNQKIEDMMRTKYF